MRKSLERESSSTNRRTPNPANNNNDDQPVERPEETESNQLFHNTEGLDGVQLITTSSTTGEGIREYRRDHSAEPKGRARSREGCLLSRQRTHSNEYIHQQDDVPTDPNIFIASNGCNSMTETDVDVDRVSEGTVHIPITPHMIVIALQYLLRKGKERSTQTVADFIRDNYPVCKSAHDFALELVNKLQCAVDAKIVNKSGSGQYSLPSNRRTKVRLLQNETKAFWSLYTRLTRKQNSGQTLSDILASQSSTSGMRRKLRVHSHDREPSTGSCYIHSSTCKHCGRSAREEVDVDCRSRNRSRSKRRYKRRTTSVTASRTSHTPRRQRKNASKSKSKSPRRAAARAHKRSQESKSKSRSQSRRRYTKKVTQPETNPPKIDTPPPQPPPTEPPNKNAQNTQNSSQPAHPPQTTEPTSTPPICPKHPKPDQNENGNPTERMSSNHYRSLHQSAPRRRSRLMTHGHTTSAVDTSPEAVRSRSRRRDDALHGTSDRSISRRKNTPGPDGRRKQ